MDQSGNFFQLISHVEGITYRDAEIKILKERLDVFTLHNPKISPSDKIKRRVRYLNDLANFEPITNDSPAYEFLIHRGLWVGNLDDFRYCSTGFFASRIIILFRKRHLVYYYQARAIDDRKPKYLNPGSDFGIKTSDILYPFNERATYVVVVESPICAYSLKLQGVNATATMTARVSRTQANILKRFPGRIILGYDNDEAGLKGIQKFDTLRRQMCMSPFEVCPPPKGYKDWNEAHIEFKIDLNDYIFTNTHPYTDDYKLRKQLGFWE